MAKSFTCILVEALESRGDGRSCFERWRRAAQSGKSEAWAAWNSPGYVAGKISKKKNSPYQIRGQTGVEEELSVDLFGFAPSYTEHKFGGGRTHLKLLKNNNS